MARILKREETGRSVLEAARERFDILYRRFDRIVVSFSGGKDSTACLQLALEAAERHKRLPVDVMFWDEEAIHPPTIEYVERIFADARIRGKWISAEIKHRNACSRAEPYWICWEASKRDRWVRDWHPLASGNPRGFRKGMTMPESFHLPYVDERATETIAMVRGLRAAESLRRARSVSMRVTDNWIMGAVHKRFFGVSPIYDWSAIDVWLYPKQLGCDYNRAYDVMDMAGLTPHEQRVCPPYGEEPLGNLWIYAVCFPELWEKMIRRVPGAATAGRYARTELYGFGKREPPPGLTWREWTFSQLELWAEPWRSNIARSIGSVMDLHASKTSRPIPEATPDPLTGLSWSYMAMLVNRGDLKDRRAGNLINQAIIQRERTGISLEDAQEADLGTRY